MRLRGFGRKAVTSSWWVPKPIFPSVSWALSPSIFPSRVYGSNSNAEKGGHGARPPCSCSSCGHAPPPREDSAPAMRRRPGRPLAAAPGGFLHLSLLTSLRHRPTLQAHAQLLLLGLPLPAAAASRLLRLHLRSGHPLASLHLFIRILRDHEPSPSSTASQEAIPNSYSLSAALAACSRHTSPTPGLSIHAFLVKSGFTSDLFAANSLLHFYASFGLHESARKLFDEMPARDSVSFNTLICSYVRSRCIEGALGVFRNMAEEGFRMVDGWTVTALLGACAGFGDLRAAKAAHGVARRVLKQKLFDSGEVVIALVSMYVKCGAVRLARQVFDFSGEKARNVRVWTIMMSGHARAGEINMARRLFDALPDKDLIAWTVMIGAFVQARRYNEAFELFEQMEAVGLVADEVTIVTVLSACVQHGRIDLGRRLHRLVDHNGLIRRNARLATGFVHMYAKHGCLQIAVAVFHGVSNEFKTVDLFNAMINGFADHGLGKKAISLFDEMGSLGLHPDEITLVGVLSACSHSGLVQQGFQIFNSMEEKYGVKPDIKHYACMADLLGRVGQLEDAYRFIQNMPFKSNHVVWSSLLRACIVHRNVKIGKIVEKQLCELDITYKCGNPTLSQLFSHETKKEPIARMRNVIKHMPEHIHSQLLEKQLCESEITCNKPAKLALSDLFSDEKTKKPAARVREAENHTLYHLFSDKKQKEKSAKVRKAIKQKSEHSPPQLAEKQLLELLLA